MRIPSAIMTKAGLVHRDDVVILKTGMYCKINDLLTDGKIAGSVITDSGARIEKTFWPVDIACLANFDTQISILQLRKELEVQQRLIDRIIKG